jgi:hypothetical protein
LRSTSPGPTDPAAPATAAAAAGGDTWRRSSTPDAAAGYGFGGQGVLTCSDPQQQLVQLKLLRERARAGQQQRLRVMRARRQLMAEARLAAVLAGGWLSSSSDVLPVSQDLGGQAYPTELLLQPTSEPSPLIGNETHAVSNWPKPSCSYCAVLCLFLMVAMHCRVCMHLLQGFCGRPGNSSRWHA